MFERFTERARRVLFFARYEASQLGQISIESEHLLLGLLREGKGLTSRLFAKHGVRLAEIATEIQRRTKSRERVSTSVEIPFSTETKRILHSAVDEADRLLHSYIGTEHLLLGIVREERSMAASILLEKGMRLQGVRDEIEQLSSDKAQAASVEDATQGFPEYLPSNTVHIAFSRRPEVAAVSSEGPRHWIMAGADLKALIARAYGVDEDRVVSPVAPVVGERYAVALVLPRDESAEAIARIIQQAIEEQFQITVTSETRPDGECLVVRPK